MKRVSFSGNPYIGMFGLCNDRIVIIPPSVPDKFLKACSALSTEPVKGTIAGSNLPGIFAAINSDWILLPNIVFSDEERILREAGVDVLILEGKLTAIGNNILINDKAAVVNPRMEREDVKRVEDIGVEVIRMSIAGYQTPGSVGVVTNKGFLIHNDATDEEIEMLEEIFGVRGASGTANMGVSFVGLCVLANGNGYVVGENTSGFELSRIEEGLGFVR